MQADALEIDAQAKRRLADEYDAAQARGEVKSAGNPNYSKAGGLPSTADLGLDSRAIHEAREIRDAEVADPGIVRRTLNEAIEAGEEPTRAGGHSRLLMPSSIHCAAAARAPPGA